METTIEKNELKYGSKLRCIESYAEFKEGDVVTLSDELFIGWTIKENNESLISPACLYKWELLNMKIEAGDTIRLKIDATMKDLTENYWNGCQPTTIDFIKDGAKGKEFIVQDVFSTHVVVDTSFQKRACVNINIVELASKKEPIKKPFKSPTKQELCELLTKELGREVYFLDRYNGFVTTGIIIARYDFPEKGLIINWEMFALPPNLITMIGQFYEELEKHRNSEKIKKDDCRFMEDIVGSTACNGYIEYELVDQICHGKPGSPFHHDEYNCRNCEYYTKKR